MSLAELTNNQKEELATSLAVLTCFDSDAEISADNLSAVLSASGNNVASYLPGLFASLIARGIKVEKALAGPSAGSASAAPAAGGAAAAAGGAAAPVVEKKEEEEEADLGGGMDMFGGGSDY